jgi:hypothetical protein
MAKFIGILTIITVLLYSACSILPSVVVLYLMG